VLDFASNVPTDGAVEKLNVWASRGAEVAYLSSHRKRDDVGLDERVLALHGFPIGPVHWRANADSCGDLVDRIGPDVVVEHDCESIGGVCKTVASQLGQERTTSCWVVPEFGGLSHLPHDPVALARH
jgi:hypothetical protein